MAQPLAYLKVPQNISKKIGAVYDYPMTLTKDFNYLLGLMIQRDIDMTFRLEGERAGHPKWIDFKNGEGVIGYLSNAGTWAKRYGTDESKTRRYSSSSKLLQASGSFRKSFGTPFGIFVNTKRSIKVGTKHELAKDIMSSPKREVVFVTDKDIRKYRKLFQRWLQNQYLTQKGKVIQ